MTHLRILSCDWGTTSLRLRLVSNDPSAKILGEFRSGEGVATLAAAVREEMRGELFQATLRAAIEQLAQQINESLDALPIVVSGMASSSIGWKSLPYARLPFKLNGDDVTSARVDFDRHRILLISGVRDGNDAMRGEETELIGLMRLPEAAELRGRFIAILPGTHSKHVEISDGAVIAFHTLMTGEVFSVLATHSILRHSVRHGDEPVALPRADDSAARTAFVDGARMSYDTDVLSALFRTRTRQLLHGQAEHLNAAYLSGALIGGEINALSRRLARDDSIVLCAGSAVADWYRMAIDAAGLPQRIVQIPAEKVDQLSVLGHIALAEKFAEEG